MFAQAQALANVGRLPRRRRVGFARRGFTLPVQASAIAHSFHGFGDTGDDVITINAQPETVNELRNRIRNNGGAIEISANESQGALNVAYNHSWQFSVERLNDGRYRIIETSFIKYAVLAGLGVGVLLLARAARG